MLGIDRLRESISLDRVTLAPIPPVVKIALPAAPAVISTGDDAPVLGEGALLDLTQEDPSPTSPNRDRLFTEGLP